MRRNILLLFIFISFLILPNLYSAQLTDFKILVEVNAPTSAHIVENWNISYDPLDLQDLENFKDAIIAANLDSTALQKIDPNIRPHIFFNKIDAVSIGFNELNNSVRIEYNINDQVLLKYFENEEEILWKFNDNLLRNFLLNDLYHVSKNSELGIDLYEPLVIEDPIPEGRVEGNSVIWSGISSNELRLVAYEQKPPKPSFFFINLFKNNYVFYLVFAVLILFSIIILFYKKKIKKSIRGFVIKNSEIERVKDKKDLFDDFD